MSKGDCIVLHPDLEAIFPSGEQCLCCGRFNDGPDGIKILGFEHWFIEDEWIWICKECIKDFYNSCEYKESEFEESEYIGGVNNEN